MKQFKIWIGIIGIVCCCLLITRYIQHNSALLFAKKMGTGWNLGNSLDSYTPLPSSAFPRDYETYWGNPVTTGELMKQIKAAGFLTVRIPVTWYEHMDENGNIDNLWMNRVQEVVDYAMENQMYVILNLHHEDWLVPSYKNKEQAELLLSNVWTQIGKRFQDYDNHLLFENMNEPRLIGDNKEWTGTPEAWKVVNLWNQSFVNTVRGLGGYNKERYLLLPTYCNSFSEEAIAAFDLPSGKHLMVTVHAYIPHDFAVNKEGTSQWSQHSPEDTNPVNQMMQSLYDAFIKRNIPVIVGEFGAVDKDNEASRSEWTAYFTQAARQKGITYLWWDDGCGNSVSESFSLFDRNTLTRKFPLIIDALIH